MISPPSDPLSRYESEIHFFDAEAKRTRRTLAPLDPLIVRRFRAQTRKRFNKELRVGLLQPLAGKRVLDIGCGDGEQAILLATLGADVTGIDISPGSIEVARERAKLEGVSDRARFLCAPLTQAEPEEAGYDVIWGDGILHHVIPDLDRVMDRIVEWGRPGARVVLTEPVNLSPTLHRIRHMVPIEANGTPDERPLEAPELEAITRRLRGVRVRPYLLFARLVKFLMPDASYERAAAARRALANILLAADYAVLSFPAMGRFAGQLVIDGTVER